MVSARVIQATDTLVEIDAQQRRGAVTRTALETGLSGDTTEAGRQKVAVALTDLLQRDIETWIHIDDLPADEETIGWNTNRMLEQFGDGMRWERQGPDRWLVSMADIITVTWDGTSYVVSLRNAR